MRKHRPNKAYLNREFLESPDARVIRILAEYLEPARRLRHLNIHDTIVFFGSARALSRQQARACLERVQQQIDQAEAPSQGLIMQLERAEKAVELAEYYEQAVELARMITQWSTSLPEDQRHFVICSGGGGGMMEAANKGASLAGGKSLGFNITLPFEQIPNEYLAPEMIFDFHYFFMRKFWFVYLAKALIIFPGGFGTMDELMEVLTLIQTKKPHKTMPVLLYGKRYWNEVLNFDAMVRWGTISPDDLEIFYITDSPEDAFEYLRTRLEELYLTPQGLEKVKLT